ncbi:MAG: universal stress protein [Methylomonas sp.]|jgi:nucleotide-binding universal stress UspA family protein|uniref:universal stress protein n=1 Tax=Methylomonas sp. TaxID=418 RepID=UPI0025E71612|nr:universal stress protein [Methylomonas sp.]MCK9604995.1 universal stress protein [Methylomonas sp.]
MQVQNNTVLACVDGSGLMPAVCDYAAWIAQRVNAPLTLMHSIDHHPETASTLDLSGNIGVDSQDQLLHDIVALELAQNKLKLQQGKLIMRAAQQRVERAGIVKPDLHQRHGSLVESLIELEEYLRVLVIGVRGKVHEHQPDKIGAKLESIIRSLHKPILVVNGAFKVPERIMIAYDGSKAADKAVDMVASSPLYRDLLCHLVCVNQDDHGGVLLEKAANTLKQESGLKLISQKLSGNPEQALCEYQNRFDIDLTIMGAFSHTRVHDLLLGSFTVKMLAQSHKSLLLLR